VRIIRILATKLPPHDIDKSLKSVILHFPDLYTSKISSMRKRSDQLSSLIGRLLLIYSLQEQGIIKGETSFLFKNDSFGKPYLENYEFLHFNISHSFEWVICGVSNSRIGVDIEKIAPINYIELSKNFFEISEYKAIIALEKFKQLDYFYYLWTAKESFLKAIGSGLSMPLHTFSISEKGEIRGTGYELHENEKYKIKKYTNIKGYAISTCTLTPNFPGSIENIHFIDLIKITFKNRELGRGNT
jgi:4'-phosphopantetheinyl transferase